MRCIRRAAIPRAMTSPPMRDWMSARRAVGQWPTAESLIEKLAAGIAQAAEHESDPERKGKLMAVARGLGSFARDVAVSVAAQTLGQHVPR
jgi:hypothetical protein